MQYSTNNHLKLMEGTDNVKRQDFVDNFNAIDNGLSKFYVATLNSTNVYKVTTGLNKTGLANGYSIRVAIPSNSTGAVSIIIDNCSAVVVKEPNGNAVSNLKANGVYSLTYYNSVFILASGGGADTVNFSASDLLTGKSANDSNGEKVDGTMINHEAKTVTLNCDGSYIIPEGYHNGQGKVSVNSLESQTNGTATANDIAKDKTAWVNGNEIVGTLENLTYNKIGSKVIIKKHTSLGLTVTTEEDGGYSIDVANPFYQQAMDKEVLQLIILPVGKLIEYLSNGGVSTGTYMSDINKYTIYRDVGMTKPMLGLFSGQLVDAGTGEVYTIDSVDTTDFMVIFMCLYKK